MRTILLADDEPDLRELVAYRLHRSGHRFVEATDGQDALEITTRTPPDLAVIDVTMPRLDGYELTRRLRKQQATGQLPVILLTARSQEADVGLGSGAGADDYLKKPFNPDELIARIPAFPGRANGAGT